MPRHSSSSPQAPPHMGPNHIVTNKRPIPLIQKDFASQNVEVGLGQTDERRLLHISFTLRGENRRVRVISARDMHRKERERYEEET